MRDLISYLFQASLCLNLLYLVYVALLSRTTFFQQNRMFLLFALMASFTIPVLTLPLPAAMSYDASGPFIEPVRHVVDISHYDLSDASPGLSGAGPEWRFILTCVYLSVLGILILRRVRVGVFLFKINRHKAEITPDGYRTVRTDLPFPFSFGRTIYLPTTMNDLMILEHEKSHIKHAHWIDLLLVEVAVMVLWFNPVIFLFRKSLKSIHEYQADSHALSVCGDLAGYLSCLLQQVRINHSGPISPFFSNTFKQRIQMMTRNPTPRFFSALYLLTVPVLVVLLAAFSFRKDGTSNNSGNLAGKQVLRVVIDPAHGGADHGATATDGTHEKDITLAVAREIQKAARGRGLQVTLTRENDASLSLAERTAFSEEHKADVYVSIHADHDPGHPEKNGMRVMINQTKMAEDNRRLGNCLLNGVGNLTGTNAGDLEEGNPYVLKNSTVPAVIVELGFLSNKKDLARLSSSGYQEEVAHSIVNGLLEYHAQQR